MSGSLGNATVPPTAHFGDQLANLVEILAGGNVVAVTGAGMSTDSGIPDYRGPGSPPRNPMTYQQFTGSAEHRRHYWARNHLGWRHIHTRHPNPGHLGLAELERAGVVRGLITQNVDLLHTKAGHRAAINLHGRYDRVACMGCGARSPRSELDTRLRAANPGFARTVTPVTGVEIAPDADAVVERTAHFRMVGCATCGGDLKPDIVFFGETVPKARVAEAFAWVDDCSAVLVLGSSLTVMSGLRFVRRAAKAGTPVVIVNRGATRADDLATVRLDAGCAEVLDAVATMLT